MTHAEEIIIAALQRGPLLWEVRAGCGWFFKSPYRRENQYQPPRRRYFRTMDVRRVLASGQAKQIGNKVVRATNAD